MKLVRQLFGISWAVLLLACGDSSTHHPQQSETNGIDDRTSIADALDGRNEASTDILIESTLTKNAAVKRKLLELKSSLDNAHKTNSICVASHRGTVGKSAFTCNDYDYDVIILARQPGEKITDNLSYFMDFAADPLRRGISNAITLLERSTLNVSEANCIRIVFRRERDHTFDLTTPILVFIRIPAEGDVAPLLETCLS